MRNKLLPILSGATLLFLFWAFFFHWTGIHQVAVTRHIFTGELSIDTISGFNITSPLVQVVRIDTRPDRLCVECDCRNITCTLVSFNPKGWKDLIEREGFRYYWWDNRISFNSGHKREYRGLSNLLKGYAFDNVEYLFIKKHNDSLKQIH